MSVLRTVAAAGACGIAVASLAACEPAAGGLDSAAVAVTTDRTATATLERLTFDVAWLSCTATVNRGASPSGATTAPGSATVDCRGETESGQTITIKGKVTDERAGKCVRGDLTARIDRKVVFQATMLGDCSAAPSSTAPGTTGPRTTAPPRPGPTVTVTETVTVTAVPAK
ncbi:hypothetical protein HW130_27450 [Streptomyces sp. PKU-EA00015]|uniref:hypothetical protein n=1 Tax=Streptomyces sp. PKU-EA00015 TaxID=2748326 RepID=UPI00159FB7C1|nr:hypothetical protein [Streptomyces sp. PKU-EA00015]NWF29953.1 hypothetical protein [Streptomyces sp. PKU-EA00015]